MFTIVVGLALAQSAAAAPRYAFEEPPMAVYPTGPVEGVLLHPLFRVPYTCSDHPFGEKTIVGDALGSDCQIIGGVLDKERSYGRLYRTDGAKNEDWFSWGADVLAPTDGIVTGLLPNNKVNPPGTKGKPPAGMMQITAADGIVVTFAHITDFQVPLGARVKAGQLVAKVGNNGPSFAPHIHIGASKGTTPLQIRWDQRALAKLWSGE